MMLADAFTASRYLAGVQQMLADHGVPPAALLSGTGLTQARLEDANGRVSVAELDRFLANAITASGDPRPGLRLGRRLNLSAHGSAGLAGLTAANARAALEVAGRYFPLITELIRLRVEETAEALIIHIEPLPELSPRCEQFVVHTLLASIALMAGFLLGEQASLVRLSLPGATDPALLERLPELRNGVRFHATGYLIELPRRILERGFALADSSAHQQALQRCEQELMALQQQRSFADRLYQQLLYSDSRIPTLNELADALSVSTRTLHRRLQAQGCRFRDLLNQARMVKAERLLRQGWSVTAIAHSLGYGDSANFTRAFRRAHGVPPSRFDRDELMRHDQG